jgi:hypothetical protein
MFRIYFKSMGKDTVCRVERSYSSDRPVIEVINSIFNKYGDEAEPSRGVTE